MRQPEETQRRCGDIKDVKILALIAVLIRTPQQQSEDVVGFHLHAGADANALDVLSIRLFDADSAEVLTILLLAPVKSHSDLEEVPAAMLYSKVMIQPH